MPPKKGGKKGSKAKSANVIAKEAELEQEVEQMRFEKQCERLRNEEFMLRQRLEEEEHKLLEDHRVRESEIRNAIAERDRHANYLAREMELTAVLDQRERETQELRAKVLGIQQAQTVLEHEREFAVRRSTMLAGELETAQQRLAEAQGKTQASAAAHDETCAALRAEFDELHAETVALHRQREDAVTQVARLLEQTADLTAKLGDNGSDLTAADGSAQAIMRAAPRSLDAESRVLLRVLQADVEKYKDIATSLQKDVERKNLDQEKSSLLVGILNTQLDSVREENKRLHAKAMRFQREAEAVSESVASEKQRNRDLYEEAEKAASESAVAHRQLQLEIGVHRKQVEELTSRLESLTDSHTKLKAKHTDVSLRSVQREQEDFVANAAMKAELDKHRADLALLAKEKQHAQDEAFNYRILTRAEMDGLKTRLQKFQETMERKDREAFETVGVLRTEASRQETERQREVNGLQMEVDRLAANYDDTREHRNRLATELARKEAKFVATERELYEKLVLMTACHDAKHGETVELRARLQDKEEAYTNNTIFLNAEKENLRARVEELLAEAQKRRGEHMAHIERVTADLRELEARMTTEMGGQDAAYAREKSRAEMAERNVKRLQEQARETESAARSTQLITDDMAKAAKADARELRSELAIAKRTIEQMEVAFGDQTGYNQLKELNERLTKENGAYHAQIAHLNSVVVAMKTEQDVMGGYKLHRASGEVERLSRVVNRLERVQKLAKPVFRELRAMSDRAGLPSSLRESLDQYDAQAARIKAADGGEPDTAAADSLHADAAADAIEKQDMTSTLPAMLRPHPPAASRSRVIEAFFDKKLLTTSVGNPANTRGNQSASTVLPAIDV